MKNRIPAFIAATFALAGSVFALPMAPSIEEAITIAKAENRSILLDFTGKDWCPGCIYLKGKILDSEAFDKAVGDKYILVELDYPRAPEKIAAIPEEKKKELEDILKAYKIEAFPSIVYMDADGLPYAIISEYTKTPEEYIAKIVKRAEDARAARDAAFAKAAGLQGIEKAKVLVAALEALPVACRDKYKDVLAEIREADPENTLGYSRIEEEAARRIEQLNAWEQHSKAFIKGLNGVPMAPQNIVAILGMCEEYLRQPDLIPEVRQKVISLIADSYAFQQNVPMVYATLYRGLAEDPDSDTLEAEKFRKTIEYYDSFLLKELNQTEAAHQAAAKYMEQVRNAAPAPAAK